MDVDRLIAVDFVVAFMQATGRAGASGAELSSKVAHVWTFRRGRIVRGEGFQGAIDALEALGPQELARRARG